jgi:hypothetical protein
MDPNDHQVVYAGGRRSGQVFKFTNVWGEYGKTEITPAEGIGDVHAIEVDLNSRVYVAASDGLRRWDGTDWTTLTGLPTANITALAIDSSTNPEIVYVGTGGDGVFVSPDGGDTWTSFNDGLENLSITKLAISETSPKTIYAGTAYGGVWSISIVEENDTDTDGVSDSLDNCPAVSNADQLDNDADGQGDVCDTDDDNDTVLDTDDNCPLVSNNNQSDVNSNSLGDACDSISDTDGDGLSDAKETQCGSNPTDPSSRCSASLPWLMLLLEDE